MRHVMLTAALALPLLAGEVLAGSDAGYAAPVDAAPAYTQHLEGFRPLPSRDWPVRGAADEDALIGAVQTAFTGAEGPPPSLVLRRSGDRLIIDVEQTGLADDSVSGTRTRGVFVTESGGGLTLFEAGIQYQCARGADAGNFTDRLCP